MKTVHHKTGNAKKHSSKRKSETNIFAASQSLVLPETITIDNIQELFVQARQLNVASQEPLIIDASHTNFITTPGIQLIISIAKSVANAGGSLVIKQSKDVFKQSFEALGFGARLTEWEETRWLKKS